MNMGKWRKPALVVLAAMTWTLGAQVAKPRHKEAHGPAGGRPWTVPEVGMEFVAVPAGSFRMGSNDGASDETPVHEVRISRPFWLGRYEVTQAEYEKLTGRNPSRFKGPRNPVELVSWNDVVAFCRKLTERERVAGRLPSGYVYRLPTEAEWEYAARGGPKSRGTEYAGSDSLDGVGWFWENSGDNPLEGKWDYKKIKANNCRTHMVGQKKPNELGIHDMSGNVWEWCLDWYAPGYYGKSPGGDPVNTDSASSRVCRGGGWLLPAGFCRVAKRMRVVPVLTYRDLGFRVCLAPDLP